MPTQASSDDLARLSWSWTCKPHDSSENLALVHHLHEVGHTHVLLVLRVDDVVVSGEIIDIISKRIQTNYDISNLRQSIFNKKSIVPFFVIHLFNRKGET